MILTAYNILVVLALILTLIHASIAPPRVPLWIPVLLICIVMLIGATVR
jgi:hypothetical protein